MKVPFLKIQQKDFVFYMTSLTASYLKDHVNFHFREPYSNDESARVNTEMFLKELENMGFAVHAQENGIQRRLQLLKVKKITDYLQSSDEAFFPNSIILSTNIFEEEFEEILNENAENYGFLTFPDSVEFQIVDGQHRLAGLFKSTDIDLNKFVLPVVLLFNLSLSTRAKIFADVNGNQTPVNMSNIYDLYGSMETSKNIEIKQKLHFLCKSFNEAKTSPLYRHVKMLGIGRGAISQSFFVNAVERALKVLDFDYQDMQGMYNSLFFYLKSYQRIFEKQWPVLENVDNMEYFYQHSGQVLKIDKSQALKTNGLGAIMRAFPKVYKAVKQQDYQSYFEIVSRLKGKVDWCSEDLRKGTGDKTQKAINDILLAGMGLIKKIITIRSQAALVEINYDFDRKVFVSVVMVCSDELNSFSPRIGQTVDEAVELMRHALMAANNAEASIVMDVLEGKYNDDEELFQKSVDSCNLLVTLKDDLKYSENAFGAIKKYVEEDGIIINKFKRIYSAKNLPLIRGALKNDCAMEENGNFWLSLQKPQS